jgi:hypothetical protein
MVQLNTIRIVFQSLKNHKYQLINRTIIGEKSN